MVLVLGGERSWYKNIQCLKESQGLFPRACAHSVPSALARPPEFSVELAGNAAPWRPALAEIPPFLPGLRLSARPPPLLHLGGQRAPGRRPPPACQVSPALDLGPHPSLHCQDMSLHTRIRHSLLSPPSTLTVPSSSVQCPVSCPLCLPCTWMEPGSLVHSVPVDSWAAHIWGHRPPSGLYQSHRRLPAFVGLAA